MTDPILTLSEEQLFGAGPAKSGHWSRPWIAMDAEPPEHVTLDLMLEPPEAFRLGFRDPEARPFVIVAGWMSKRFLGGKPTYWAWMPCFGASDSPAGSRPDAPKCKVELVHPRRWRLSDKESSAP